VRHYSAKNIDFACNFYHVALDVLKFILRSNILVGCLGEPLITSKVF
jgi:hypothetical protein